MHDSMSGTTPALVLSLVRIKDFALIEEAEVPFGAGLNVLTGETGAGKSVVISAIEVILGGRASADVIRHGAGEAVIEALFDISLDPSANSAFAEELVQRGVALDEQLIVRRVISREGRGRCYLNGNLINAKQLGDVVGSFVDVSSQHAYHQLTKVTNHISHLDAFAGASSELRDMKEAFAAHQEVQRELRHLADTQAGHADRQEWISFQLERLGRAALNDVDEDTKLAERRERLRHADELHRVASGAAEALYSSDGAASETLTRWQRQVEGITRLDASLSPLAAVLEQARLQVEEAARDLEEYAGRLELDPAALPAVEERLAELSDVKRRFGGTLAEVMEREAALADELASLDNPEGRLEEVRVRAEVAAKVALEKAEVLGRKRMAAAKALSEKVSQELCSLGMSAAAFTVEVRVPSTPDVAALSASGVDSVEFLLTPNRGEAAKPLAKIASGGELSRVMLAIKRVMGEVDRPGLFVFDEVDAGVGGAVGEIIGQKVKQVSRNHQVLCITHLPQIAAYADRHFQVSKTASAGRTLSQIKWLDSREQVLDELARMLGGLRVSEKTRDAAAELWNGAQEEQAAQRRKSEIGVRRARASKPGARAT